MDLLERYLQAIGQYLPEESKQDTLAELRANLLEQMDAREEELRRPLVESDVAAILKQHGKPELVALRYLPQRSLIGPTIFPFYLLTLRKLLPLVVLAYAIAIAARTFSAIGGRMSAGQIGDAVWGLIPILLTCWASLTIVFAVIEIWAKRAHQQGKDWNQWDPAKLPRLARPEGQPKIKSQAGRVIDLVVHCVWIAMVFEIPRHPLLVFGPGAPFLRRTMPLAPIWHTFFAVLIVLLTVQLVQKIGALYGPHRWDVPVQWTVKLMGLAILVLMATATTYFLPAAGLWDAQRLVAINHAVNTGFKVVLAIAVVQLLVDAWKYGKRWIPAGKFAF